MRTAEFKKLSRGYMEGFDYLGHGYFIEKGEEWGVRTWYVFVARRCKFHKDGYVDTDRARLVGKFDTIAEAKEYCRNNRRDK